MPHSNSYSLVFFFFFLAVRYGRVPKRSRELNGGTPSSTEDPNAVVVVNSCDLRRVSTPGTPNTPQTPQMCSIASSPSELSGCNANTNNNATNSSGLVGPSNGGGVGVGVSVGVSMGGVGNLNAQQLQTGHHESHHHLNDAMMAGTGNELSVYDVIMCVSQAHRMNCAYTEEQTRDLMRHPLNVPPNGVSIPFYISLLLH